MGGAIRIHNAGVGLIWNDISEYELFLGGQLQGMRPHVKQRTTREEDGGAIEHGGTYISIAHLQSGLEPSQPDIAEAHRAAVPAECERTLNIVMLVFRNDPVAGFAVDFFVQEDQNTVLKNSHSRG